jgi:hypothetical protein
MCDKMWVLSFKKGMIYISYMYVIEVNQKNDEQLMCICGNRDDLLSLCCIFEGSQLVKGFKVSFGANTSLRAEDFGWSEFSKWVQYFHSM